MDIKALSPDYAVSEQILPADVPAIAAAGFKTVLCNRPDAEVPPQLQAEQMRVAVEAAGLEFAVLPVTHQTLCVELADEQERLCGATDGPVLAYCASGTRCSIVWSIFQAGKLGTDDILSATSRAGYQLEQMRGQLDAIAQMRDQP